MIPNMVMKGYIHELLLPLLALACLLPVACGNGVTSPSTGYQPMSPPDFPNGVGSRWVYSVYYLPEKKSDTLTVSIYGDTVLPSGEVAAIWRYAWTSFADTEYVVAQGNTVKGYFNDSAGYELADEFIYPLVPGKRWADGLPGDTSLVVDVGAFAVPAGMFNGVVRIDRQLPKLRQYLWLSTWIVPSVGVIGWTKHRYDFGPFEATGTEEYRLLQYTPA